MNACYSINRKAQYVTIYNDDSRYPLDMWNELRAQQDLTHQQLADHMLKMTKEGNRHEA